MSDSHDGTAAATGSQEDPHVEMAQSLSAAVREAVGREHRSLVPAVIFDARPH